MKKLFGASLIALVLSITSCTLDEASPTSEIRPTSADPAVMTGIPASKPSRRPALMVNFQNP